MRRRLFFAVNLDKQCISAVRAAVAGAERALGPENARRIRFVPEDNWHVTVLFLGGQDDADLPAIIEAAGKCAERFAAPDLAFDRIMYGPPRGTPRMVWLHAPDAVSKTLGAIQTKLEEELALRRVPFTAEHRPFSAHITLARFPEGFRGTGLPPIEKNMSARSVPESIDLMESELRPGGAEYSVLQRFPFGL